MTFDLAHSFVARWEGGVSDHPNDRGGITAYGASLAFVRDVAQTRTGRDLLQTLGIATPVTRSVILGLSKEQVKNLFRKWFWERPRICTAPPVLAIALYDSAVNMGEGTAIRMAQQACNQAGAHLSIDGIIGPLTLAAMHSNPNTITTNLLHLRQAKYNSIAQTNKSQQVFLKGWLNRLNSLRALLHQEFNI